ncbi:MAG: starch-binding protein [Paludibacteraceae bacterium]|nr:starch-binding protein [Paludibacteraceae bacterium]
MKKYLIALAAIISAIIVIAQSQIWVYQSDGTRYSYDYSMFDSLSRVTPGTLALSQSERTIPCEGETFNLAIYASQPWKATVSDAKRVSLSKMQGDGNDDISVKVSVNKQSEKAYSTITFQLADGTKNSITLIAEEWEDKVTINPSSKLFTPAGGTFKMGISSNTDWKVSASEPWVTFDKTNGTLNDSIKVIVAKSDKVEPTKATITVTTSNGKTAHCIVYHEGDRVSVNPTFHKGILHNGDQFTINVLSNTDWTVNADNSNVSFDKTLGTNNREIIVTVMNIGDADPKKANARRISLRRDGCFIENTPYLYYWNSSDSPYWPGVPMNLSSNGEWWYYDIDDIDYTDSKFGIIFNKDGYVQTDNILGITDDACFVVDNVDDWFLTASLIECDKEVSNITVTTSNGKTAQCNVIQEAESLKVNPITKYIAFEGGSFDVSVTSNTEWTASSNRSWASVSIEQGTGDALFVINVASGVDKAKADTAIVTCTTTLGKSATVTIYRAGYIGAGENVTDINGSSYSTVWIGGQNWMAENLRCDKYDTESEAYKEGRYVVPTDVSTSEDYDVYTPYYIDVSDKSKWSEHSAQYADNLTDAQVARLGYLYSWAAVVGVADGERQTTEFSGKRQGICPNGWHIPSRAEWQTLKDYIEKTDGKGSDTAGNHLKTTSGWYSNGNGLDSYGFAALPAGFYRGELRIYDTGGYTYFWTATPSEIDSGSAYLRSIFWKGDWLLDFADRKDRGQSVRCLRN